MFWNFFKKAVKQTVGKDKIPPMPAKPSKSSTSAKRLSIPVSFLKRLMPLAQLLTETEMQRLSITASNFTPGTIIFNRGTEVDALNYLVKGNVFMVDNNGAELEINANTLKALYPMSSGKIHYFTAIAGSDVTVIHVPKTILEQKSSVIIRQDDSLRISKELENNVFISRFKNHVLQGKFKTPNFPDIAIKVRKAIQEDYEIVDIVKIINMDPVISAKLIQVVNSPVYRAAIPISNCYDAINRLGLTSTRNLVTSFSMNNLIKSESGLTRKLIHYHWLQSIRVSSISYILAQLTKKVDSDEALLAGLLHNIGVLPILSFADSLPLNSIQAIDVELCINEVYGQLGTIILEKWEFPDNLKHIPLLSSDWFSSTTDTLALNDIVILARYHNALMAGNNKLPSLTTLPAFQKMDNQLLTPEMSLQLLDDAKQQIAETMSFFSN